MLSRIVCITSYMQTGRVTGNDFYTSDLKVGMEAKKRLLIRCFSMNIKETWHSIEGLSVHKAEVHEA